MAPVWEANHVWLIFVIVVAWTAYPTVLASITSTLTIPLFVAAIGIILRGTAYALRAQADGAVATRTERLLRGVVDPHPVRAGRGGGRDRVRARSRRERRRRSLVELAQRHPASRSGC